MSKTNKLPELTSDDREKLAKLASCPEFEAFVKLIRLEKNNIVLLSWNDAYSRADLAQRKAWFEGRMYETASIIKIINSCKKDEPAK